MYFQEIVRPTKLLQTLPTISECFFLIEAQLPKKTYRVAIYKYDFEYFALTDCQIFRRIAEFLDTDTGDEYQLFPIIEEALEENLYYKVPTEYVRLELATLACLENETKINAHFYVFSN